MAGQDEQLVQWFETLLESIDDLEEVSEADAQRIKNGRYIDEEEGMFSEDDDGNEVVEDNLNFTLLHYAAKKNMPYVVHALITKFGMDPNAKTSMGTTPLSVAIGRTDPDTTDTVTTLVEGGADVNTIGRNRTPLSLALIRNNTPVIDYLLGHGADVNARDYWQQTAIFNVRDVSQIDKLVAKGADVNAVDTHGRTAIFDPISYGHDRLVLVKKLVEVGLDWSVVDKQGETAETYARRRGGFGSPELVEYLAKLRTDKEVKEKGQRATEVRGATEVSLKKGLPSTATKTMNEYLVGSPVELPAVPKRIRAQIAETMRRERGAKSEAAEAVAAMKAGRKTRVRKTRVRKTKRRKTLRRK